jgi:two-component system LytT family response regulator
MSLKILIADDEKEARALIKHFLQELHPSSIVKETFDGNETMAYLRGEKFDIVFLDIKMPGLSGVDIIKLLPADVPAIIFTTAFNKHALMAFEHNAVDYLLKPFNKARFEKALNKALDYIELKSLKKQKNFLTHLPIKRGTKTTLLPVKEIEFFQTNDDYISIVTTTSAFLLSSTLNELENALDGKIFIRIHKSTIINTAFIKKIESLPSGDLIIYTKSDKRIRASRNYKERIRMLL